MIIRDANAQSPAAFGARTVFDRSAVAEDEPFGIGFGHLDPVDAEEMRREQLKTLPAADAGALLTAVAAAWGLRLGSHDCGAVGAAEKLTCGRPVRHRCYHRCILDHT